MTLKRLQTALDEMRVHLEDNSEYEPDDPPDEDDALDALLEECGQQPDGTCLLAGTEYCDWDCPFS